MPRHRKGLPDDWDTIAGEQLGAWPWFTVDEQERLAGSADWLLHHKDWEAAHGFAIDDRIRTTIALEAAVLVLERDLDLYRDVGAIVVFPNAFVNRAPHAGPVPGTLSEAEDPVLGEAHDGRGAVLIAWDSALAAAREPGHGRNVVFHEFAHKIDMLDGTVDGTPPLEPDQVARWVTACTDAYEALRAGRHRGPLDFYGGVSPGEFFAVATEAFFDAAVALERDEPDLYAVLGDFYRQDPAARAGQV